jgi:hypothetical protein
MKLPDKFILAFPDGANKYIYYTSYWVDMTQKTITRTIDDYSGLFLMCRTQYESYDHHTTDLLKNRILGKPSRYERKFISNGTYNESNWFHRRFSRDDDEKSGGWPIRFHPYAANFVDGDFDGWIENKELDELYVKIDRKFRYGSYRVIYDAPFSEWEDCEAMLSRAFQLMSHCQVVMRIDRRGNKSRKIKKLKDLYENLSETLISQSWHRTNSYSHDQLKLIDLIFPPKESKSAKKKQEIIKESIQRFVRRHPTRATTTLLKMIAFCTGIGGTNRYTLPKPART